MEKHTVILYNPKQYVMGENQFKAMPYSLLALSAVLEPDKYVVVIIDGFFTPNPENELKKYKNILAIGVTTITGEVIIDALQFSKSARKICPGVPIIWGGSHPSVCPHDTINDPHIDYVVKGQGEVPFKRLLECLIEGKSAENIPGLTLKKNGEMIDNPIETPKNVNDFPPFPYHLLDVGQYVDSYPVIGKRTLVYITSQGCPFGCKFCSDVVLYKNKWSGLSPERMFNDISIFKERYNVDSVMFYDNNFFVDMRRVVGLCNLLIDNNINIKWCGDIRVDQFNRIKDEEMEAMVKAGCISFLVGAESGNEKVLEIVRKRIKPKDIIDMAIRAKKYKFKVVYSFMTGFPEIYEEELKDTMSLIMKLRDIDKESRIIFCMYAPYPGADLTKTYEHLFTFPNSLDGWATFTLTKNTSITSWIGSDHTKLLHSVSNFYLPLAFSNLNLWNEIRVLGETNQVVNVLHKILQNIAIFRLRKGYYSFLFEEPIINMVLSIRRKLKKYIRRPGKT
ncbi:MAG: B12-binding domain-containing radical SAM protein [Nitrospirae bacterium]|nr:B12-binding domain-containing radical SAM protein [Nitrospirota bacterium]